MSDFNSSLPTRTQTNGDVVVQVVDGTTISQKLAVDSTGRVTVKLDDAAGNAITSQVNGAQRAIDVGINVSGVQIDPRQIRALTASDVVTSNQGTAGSTSWLTKDASDGPVAPGTVASFSMLNGGQFNTVLPTLTNTQQAALQVDSSGRLYVNIAASAGAIAVTQSTSPWVTSDLADGSVAAGTAGTKSILGGLVFNTAAPSLTNGQQVALQGDSSGNLKVNLQTAIPAGTNSIGNIGTVTTVSAVTAITNALPAGTNLLGAVNLDIGGTAVSPTNPIPVYLQDGGTSINNYNTAAAVAAGATSNHDYTVTAAKTLHLNQFHAAASGKLKIECQIETGVATGVFNSIFVGFNSTSNPNIDIPIFAEIDVAAGVRVRIIRTNNDLVAQDVYSTTSGHEQ